PLALGRGPGPRPAAAPPAHGADGPADRSDAWVGRRDPAVVGRPAAGQPDRGMASGHLLGRGPGGHRRAAVPAARERQAARRGGPFLTPAVAVPHRGRWTLPGPTNLRRVPRADTGHTRRAGRHRHRSTAPEGGLRGATTTRTFLAGVDGGRRGAAGARGGRPAGRGERDPHVVGPVPG